MSLSLTALFQSHADDVLARIAHDEQATANALQRRYSHNEPNAGRAKKIAHHQRRADAARKELKRRKRDR